MRTACSSGVTKILPSPICPVLAAAVIDVDDLVDLLARDRDFDANLRQEIHGVFGAAINLHVALLAAIAFDLGHGHAVNADAGERVAHLVELEGFDDGETNFMRVLPGRDA